MTILYVWTMFGLVGAVLGAGRAMTSMGAVWRFLAGMALGPISCAAELGRIAERRRR